MRGKHGKTGSSEFRIWTGMKQRCSNERCHNYKNYGGRGISVCERWQHSFETFFSDMGPRPEGMSLDRINNDGNYEPDNCRWATREVQNKNNRNAKWVTVNGETLTMGDWARKLGLSDNTICTRIKRGWTIHEAMTTPNASPKGITFNGRTLTMRQWSKSLGLGRSGISDRLKHGWDLRSALTLGRQK